MDSAKRCREQSADCLRLKQSAQGEIEARNPGKLCNRAGSRPGARLETDGPNGTFQRTLGPFLWPPTEAALLWRL
jgi:hypothetical protein